MPESWQDFKAESDYESALSSEVLKTTTAGATTIEIRRIAVNMSCIGFTSPAPTFIGRVNQCVNNHVVSIEPYSNQRGSLAGFTSCFTEIVGGFRCCSVSDPPLRYIRSDGFNR